MIQSYLNKMESQTNFYRTHAHIEYIKINLVSNYKGKKDMLGRQEEESQIKCVHVYFRDILKAKEDI